MHATTEPKVQKVTKQADGSLDIVWADGSQGTLTANDEKDLTIQAYFIHLLIQGE